MARSEYPGINVITDLKDIIEELTTFIDNLDNHIIPTYTELEGIRYINGLTVDKTNLSNKLKILKDDYKQFIGQ